MEHGANPRIISCDSRNSFEYAITELGDNHISLIKSMLYGARLYSDRSQNGILGYLHQCCIALKNVPVVKCAEELLQVGADINQQEGKGRYVVHGSFCSVFKAYQHFTYLTLLRKYLPAQSQQ